ncbi:hypothetical protein ACIP97_13935 [Peribacillus frigoritolerans]|uniref:hypothetical protein n=1 Tax=Peribacillus frigoritolerans TaxID=450367 RepID=UPI00382030DB
MRFLKRFFMFLISLVVLTILIILCTKQFLVVSNDKNFFNALSAISTTVAAIGGIILLFITYFTFLETRQQRISREEPAVTLRLAPDRKNSNFLNIAFKNSGGGPAYDIQVLFSPDLPYGQSSLNKLNMFKRMPLLDAGEEVVFFYDSLVDYMDSKNPKTVQAKVSYYTFPKGTRSAKKISRSFEMNFDERYGQRQIVAKDMNNLVKEIEELKHAIIITSLERGDNHNS